jgi:hypothetical protein
MEDRMPMTTLVRRVATHLTLGSLLALAWPAWAQDATRPAPRPCSGPEHRQFDFWVGDWEVAQPDGTVAGTNRVEIILGGCVLQENWESANGKSVGHSFNLYARDGKWHQTWVDNSGLLLELVGGVEDGRMVMSQERTTPQGQKALHEISWTRLETGQVKQHWRMTTDEGQTWKDVFVGIYTRK